MSGIFVIPKSSGVFWPIIHSKAQVHRIFAFQNGGRRRAEGNGKERRFFNENRLSRSLPYHSHPPGSYNFRSFYGTGRFSNFLVLFRALVRPFVLYKDFETVGGLPGEERNQNNILSI